MFNRIKMECACGAKLEVEATFDSTLQDIYRKWQAEHSKHKQKKGKK